MQACIEASAAGDGIELAFDDLNNETLTVIDKSMTLRPAAGRTPKLKSLFVASGKQAVAFTVEGLAGLGQMAAFCGKSDLALTVRDNVIGGGSEGLRVYDNYALTDSGQRTITIVGNRFSIGGLEADNAISISGSISAFVANVVDNDIHFTSATKHSAIDVYAGANSAAAMTQRVVIDRNRIGGADFNAGISLIAGGGDSTWPGVTLDASVTNNLVVGQSGNTGASGGITGYSSGSNTSLVARISNNTVVDGRTGISFGTRADLSGFAYVTARNNIVAFNSSYGIGIPADSLVASSYNLVFGNGVDGEVSPAGTIVADPLFIDRGAKDYRPALDSPAINAGLDAALSPIFKFDVAGNSRRVGRIDIGAYEAEPGAPTMTALVISPKTVEANRPATATVTVSSLLPTLGGAASLEFAASVVTGKVEVVSSNGERCIAILSNGNGACTLSHSVSGTHVITATYVGNGRNAMSSDTASLVVTPANPMPAPALSDGLLGLLAAALVLAGARAVRGHA